MFIVNLDIQIRGMFVQLGNGFRQFLLRLKRGLTLIPRYVECRSAHIVLPSS